MPGPWWPGFLIGSELAVPSVVLLSRHDEVFSGKLLYRHSAADWPGADWRGGLSGLGPGGDAGLCGRGADCGGGGAGADAGEAG